MVKREWTGPPLDLTDQHFKERPMSGTPTRDDENGETVAGSTEDDLFSESTDNIPTYIDRESTPNQILNVIGWAVSVSYRYAVNQQQEFNVREVRQILADYLREEDFERINGIEAAPCIDVSELSEKQRQAVTAFQEHENFPEVSINQLSDDTGISKAVVRRAIHKTYHGLRDYDDLHEASQLAVLVWAYEGMDHSPNALEEDYPVSSTTLGETRRTYPDLIADAEPVAEGELTKFVSQYEEKKQATKKDRSTGAIGTSKPLDEREYPDDYTDMQEWFIESIAKEPWIEPGELGERTNHSGNNYHQVIQKFPEIIKRRIKEVGAAESTDEIRDYILDNTAHLGEWNLGGSDELEQEIDAEEVAEIEAEPEAEIETEPEFDSNATERFGFDIEEEVEAELDLSRYSSTRVLLRPELVEGVKDRLVEADEYKSMTELVNAAVKKELNGGFGSPEPDAVQADVIETVIESIYGERKASAIRTLISDE